MGVKQRLSKLPKQADEGDGNVVTGSAVFHSLL